MGTSGTDCGVTGVIDLAPFLLPWVVGLQSFEDSSRSDTSTDPGIGGD